MISIKILTLFAVAVLSMLNTSSGQEKGCKAIMSEMTKKQLQGITKCSKTMKFKNGKDKAAKMTCIIKCVMTNEGVLGPDGRLDELTLERNLEEKAPPAMKDKVKELIGGCAKEHGSKIDPSDEFCKSYEPLIKCFMQAIMQLCPP